MPVYAGVMVLASAAMARRLAAAIPDIEIPGWLAGKVARDKMAGVEAACEQITRLRDSGAFDGVPPGAGEPLPGNLRTPGSTRLTGPSQHVATALPDSSTDATPGPDPCWQTAWLVTTNVAWHIKPVKVCSAH